MSLALKPIEISNKNELLSLVVGQLKEEPHSFQILDRQLGTRSSGTADLVALDAEGRLSLLYLLPEKEEEGFLSALSNYVWACENIFNIKKIYPQAGFSASEAPRLVFLARTFSSKLRKAFDLLKAEKLLALEYRSFEVNGLPCLLLEPIKLHEAEEALQDIEIERLKREFATGSRFLSEEEILEFINFEKSLKP